MSKKKKSHRLHSTPGLPCFEKALNKMIENTDKGPSGFWTDDYEGCGNPAIFPAFEKGLKHGEYVYIEHEICPYIKDILHGGNSWEGSFGCYHKCGIGTAVYLNADELKEVLFRFKNNLEKDVYKEGEKIEPLLTDKEIKAINTRRKREQDKRHREYEKHEKLHEQTLKEKIENLIVFHGNNLNPLPEKIFFLYKSIIERTKNKALPSNAKTHEILNNCDWDDIEYIPGKSGLGYYHYCRDYWDCVDEDYYFPFNSTVGISLYHDYELNQDLFYLTFLCDDEDVDLKFFQNKRRHVFYVNNKLKELYAEIKQFREENPHKYIQLYKNTKIQDFLNEVDLHNQIFCNELCLFSEQCNRISCMLPESQIHEVKAPEMYKINLHILEPCNFRCRHCFAHFDNHKMLNVNEWMHIVDNCADYLFVNEFNIAGGEPLLYKDLAKLAKYIHYKGARLSIITNGFLMSDKWIDENAGFYNTIGFSIDSFTPDIQIAQGRCTSDKKILSLERFKEICLRIHKTNPETKLKINTVVTSLNKNENIAVSIKALQEAGVKISRWKIIKMDVFKNETFDNSDIAVSNEEYKEFAALSLKEFGVEPKEETLIRLDSGMDIVIEKDVAGAYIMIDANGWLVDNTKNLNYEPLIDCVTEEFEEGWKKLSFDKELFFSRYKQTKTDQ